MYAQPAYASSHSGLLFRLASRVCHHMKAVTKGAFVPTFNTLTLESFTSPFTPCSPPSPSSRHILDPPSQPHLKLSSSFTPQTILLPHPSQTTTPSPTLQECISSPPSSSSSPLSPSHSPTPTLAHKPAPKKPSTPPPSDSNPTSSRPPPPPSKISTSQPTTPLQPLTTPPSPPKRLRTRASSVS